MQYDTPSASSFACRRAGAPIRKSCVRCIRVDMCVYIYVYIYIYSYYIYIYIVCVYIYIHIT